MNSPSLAFLLTVLFSGPTWALGLDEIVVQSSLGKPFRATIKVLDAPKDIQPECFGLLSGNDAGLPGAADARIRLETRGGDTTLFISTAHTINDPVLQITVSARCVDQLQREYVVLLDPPSSHEPATAMTETSLVHADSSRLPRKLTRRPRPKNTLARIHTTMRPSRASSGKPKAGATAARPVLGKPMDSHLVLSGSHYRPVPLDPTVAVSLDVENKPDSSRAQPAMSPTELSDEHTSLGHRLAYLQAQLTELQKRNDELEAHGRPIKAPLPLPAPQDKISLWSQFLIGLGLPTGGLALFFGLRAYNRRSVVGAGRGPATAASSLVCLSDTSLENPTAIATEPLNLAAPAPHPEGAANFTQSLSAYGTEVNEDILDQAEVYVAHGHASLAIHLLQEHVREAPTESPVPWLLLLDLLTREGHEAEYRTTCIACKKYYNLNLSAAPAVPPMPGGASLEAYPHLIAQLQTLWGTREAVAFLADLVYDRRDGTRQGFDPGAYREIMLLREMAEKEVYAPQTAPLPLPVAPNTPAKNPSMGESMKAVRDERTPAPEQGLTTEQRLVSEPMPVSAQGPDPKPEDALSQSFLTYDTIIKENILEQVQHYVANDQTELAIYWLQQRVREAPTVSPGPWLLLLDLLARAGLNTQYQTASIECQSLFNINLSAHSAAPNTSGEASLEAYPHVMAQLQTVWDTPEAEDFLSNLLYDHRGGIRQGFNPGAYREILLLRTLAEAYTGAA